MLNYKAKFYSCHIPSSILSLDKKILSDSEKIVLSIIIILSKNELGFCYVSNTYLANFLGKNIQQITRTVTSLVKKNYIKRTIITNLYTKKIAQRRLYLSENTKSLIKNNTTSTIKNDTLPTIKNDYTYKNRNKLDYVNNENKGNSFVNRYLSFEDYSNKFFLNETIKSVLDYYLISFKENRISEHPKLRVEQWKNIEDKLISYAEEYSLNFDNWKEIIDKHFKTKYYQHCDYKLLHFISPKIIENRYYEEIY